MSVFKDTKFERKHPSYGALRISRVSGGIGRLYGSSLRDHHASIRLEIAPSTWSHTLNHDTFHGSVQPHIEIEMSAAQFAEAITSLNMGSGVPCTVRYFNGKRVEEMPDDKTEVEQVKDGFKDDMRDMVAKMKERRTEIEKVTDKLSQKAKDTIRIALDVIIQQVTSNLPFILRQFDEATTRVVTAAKAEIEAFALNRLTTAGLKALAAEEAETKLLTSSVDGFEPPPDEMPESLKTRGTNERCCLASGFPPGNHALGCPNAGSEFEP